MIIALNAKHPAAEQLEKITTDLRAKFRGETSELPDALAVALDIIETRHGHGSVTYVMKAGHASSEQAIETYQFVRKFYPGVLDILCHAASRNASQISVEIGSTSPENAIAYSHHDLLRIMPHVLAQFRGTLRPRPTQ